MQGKKALFLFLALLLPIGIFIFLKLFGKNEFDVPAFYQDKGPVVNASCPYVYQAPYRVADSVMTKLERQKNALYLIHFAALGPRLKQEVDDPQISSILATDFFRQDELNVLRNCILLVPAAQDMVVVDNDGKIRGYYNSADREEVDRLLLEFEILLKKY
ncbi:MAG TPA: hypothetical protein VGD65_16680 [Chryseosolibacter sp.]